MPPLEHVVTTLKQDVAFDLNLTGQVKGLTMVPKGCIIVLKE